MLFQVLGALLARAGACVDASFTGDDHSDLQRRRIALLLTRVGRFYPSLFAALAEENVRLAGLHDELVAAMRDNDVFVPSVAADDDPLERNRALHLAIDDLAVRLHHADAAWARHARSVLRRGLADAARRQHEMVMKGFA